MSGVIVPDKETAKALNDKARHENILRLLADIRVDTMICECEGWDQMEYVRMLRDLLDSLGGQE